jgi:hypothetical protein
MTQIIEISTQYQLANLAALIRAGRLGDRDERRILLVANNSFAPELTPAADAMPGSRGLLADFDTVVDWNATIWPNHPKAFGISGERAPVMERSLRREWDIDDHEPLELIVESLPGHPGRSAHADLRHRRHQRPFGRADELRADPQPAHPAAVAAA